MRVALDKLSSKHKKGEIWLVRDGYDTLIIKLKHNTDMLEDTYFHATILKGNRTYTPERPDLFFTEMIRLKYKIRKDKVEGFSLGRKLRDANDRLTESHYRKTHRYDNLADGSTILMNIQQMFKEVSWRR